MERVLNFINERFIKSYKSSIVGVVLGVLIYYGIDLTPCISASNIEYTKNIVSFLPILIGLIKKDK